MLLDIKNLLRADKPNREPMPKAAAYHAARKAKAPSMTKAVERPPRKSNMHAMASELDNFSLADFPLEAFNAEVEHQLKIQTWKSAIRGVHDDPEFTFPAAPRRDRPANEHMHGLVVVEDSDLSTLFGSDYTGASTETIKVVDLFSLEEINSKKNAFIPPLIIRHNDIIGDRRLALKQDGFMHYDISVDPLHHVISCRGVTVLPNAPSQMFFKNHALRVFFECPPVPGIKNGPFYKYIGDYYLKRTEKYLPKEQWAAANKEIKDVFVRRFIEANNKTDNYRTPNNFTKEYVHDLFARGYIFPLVVLQHAHPADLYESASPSMSMECFEVPSSAGASCDSDSIYSQESAPWDGEECPFEAYSTAAGLRVPPSPAPVRVRRPLVTYEDGAQVIHLDYDFAPCYSEAGAVPDESPVLERSVFGGGDDDDDRKGAAYPEDDHGGEIVADHGHAVLSDASEVFYDDHGNILKSVFEHDDDDEGAQDYNTHPDKDDNAFVSTEDEANEVSSTHSEATESGTTPLQRAAEFILRLMKAKYHEIQSFCVYLEETSDPGTEEGRARLELLRILQDYSTPIAAWEDSSSDGNDDAQSDVTQRLPAASRLPMVPWFDGFEPLPIVITEDRV